MGIEKNRRKEASLYETQHSIIPVFQHSNELIEEVKEWQI
jgi:hypothetical protein